ncbi:MuDR family transposase, partial [Striga hermonthica]
NLNSTKCSSILTPPFEQKMRNSYNESNGLEVLNVSLMILQVGGRHIVDLEERLCTCRKFQVDMFPCAHAIAAIRFENGNGYRFCTGMYSSASWRETYSQPIHPLSSETDWMVPEQIMSRRDAGSNRAQEIRAADAAAMPPLPPQNPTAAPLGGAAAQPGGVAGQGGAPPQATMQIPGQQVVMTRQEMQQMVAEAAAQAVQQVTNSLSQATAMSNIVAGSRQNAEEDESSYGGGGPPHDREMERMAEQLRQLQAKVDGRAERRARGHLFSADILAAPLPNNYKDTNLVFDGTSDPSRHVRTFENMAVLHGYTDPVSCRAFLSTLQ